MFLERKWKGIDIPFDLYGCGMSFLMSVCSAADPEKPDSRKLKFLHSGFKLTLVALK